MNRTETINNIKIGLKKLFGAETKAFSDFVLTDGTKITTAAKDLEVGAEIYMLDDQGNQTPLDDGEYVINDGRTITVAANVITEIEGPDATATETPVAEAKPGDVKQEKMEDGLADTPSDEGDLASRVSDLENQMEQIIEMLKTLTDGTQTANEQMMSKINILSGEPGDTPIKTGKKGFETYDKKKINERKSSQMMEELREYIEIKNKSNRI